MKRARVSVHGVQTRDDGRSKPYLVRWSVNGQMHSESFELKSLAEDRYAELRVLSRNPATKWDRKSGRPANEIDASQVDVATFCRLYVGREWTTLEQSSRRSIVETLTALVQISAVPGARELTAKERKELSAWLIPSAPGALTPELEAWIERYSPRLEDLEKDDVATIHARLRVGTKGQAIAANYLTRRLATVKRCLTKAVQWGYMSELEWPATDIGEMSRKANSTDDAVDVSSVPMPADLRRIIDAISNQMYKTMSAVGAYAGLRPGEVVALEVADLVIVKGGWGTLRVAKAWVGAGDSFGAVEVGKTKTGKERTVPLSPVLGEILTEWLEGQAITSGPLFRTRGQKRPTQSNWIRALAQAASDTDTPRLTPYDLRHTHASHLSAAGVPIAEAAARMGHRPETMLKHYTHRVAGHEALSNSLLDNFLEDL